MDYKWYAEDDGTVVSTERAIGRRLQRCENDLEAREFIISYLAMLTEFAIDNAGERRGLKHDSQLMYMLGVDGIVKDCSP